MSNPYEVVIQPDAKSHIIAKYEGRTRVSTIDGDGWVVSIGDKIWVMLDDDDSQPRPYQPWSAVLVDAAEVTRE